MGRILNLLLLGAMILGAAITYDMKYNAGTAANRVVKLQANIAREKAAIQALKAEWSMLDQPARLQAVTERHADVFKLQPFTPDQLAGLDDIPQKPVEDDPIGAIASGAFAEKPIALR